MNEDALLKNKIPGDHTGIEIKKTVCDICSPSCHCGVDAYVKDGVIIKVEGTKGHPFNDGVLCTKGCAGRQYIYRPDRIKTPLLRTGEKGEGKFEEITWDRAFDIITEKLGAYRDAGEASAVAFYSGYSKWYRPWLKRLCHLYGSQSFGTESSACATSRNMAWQITAGTMAAPDLKNARLFFGWALNPYYSNHIQAKKLTELKKQGLKIIVVDPRITPASEKLGRQRS